MIQILKGVDASENWSAGWIENGKNDYKCLKRAVESTHPSPSPNIYETTFSKPHQKARGYLKENWHRLTLDLGVAGSLWEQWWHTPTNSQVPEF